MVIAAALGASAAGAAAQEAAPAVGVVPVVRKPVTRSSEYIGRVQAEQRVNVVARVSAFLEERFFTEGAEVKAGDLLYRLEQAPYKADIAAKEAAIAQYKAQLQNAQLTLERAKKLLQGPAGMQSTVDSALANQLSLEAQVQAAQAQLDTSRINLGYTEIRAPIDGKIGRTAVTPGNYVTPGSGVLTTIVSQDPMYVAFPVSTREALALRSRAGSFRSLVIKIRLPDGSTYGQNGKLDFVDNTVGGNTDTIMLRGTIPNPPLPKDRGLGLARELVDGELVTVMLQDAQPVQADSVPMAAILSDQEGNYVYVVDSDNKAQIRRVQLGQSPSPSLAMVTSGLKEGENVILEGIQRVHPGGVVSPAPASAAALPAADHARGTALEDDTSQHPRG